MKRATHIHDVERSKKSKMIEFMICGAEDAKRPSVLPQSFEYVEPERASEATCQRCIDGLATKKTRRQGT